MSFLSNNFFWALKRPSFFYWKTANILLGYAFKSIDFSALEEDYQGTAQHIIYFIIYLEWPAFSDAHSLEQTQKSHPKRQLRMTLWIGTNFQTTIVARKKGLSVRLRIFRARVPSGK